MDVRIAEERTRGKIASRIRRIRWLGRKGLLGRCLIECAYVRYGLLGGERWQSEAGNTRHKNNRECLCHKSSSHNSKCMGFHKCGSVTIETLPMLSRGLALRYQVVRLPETLWPWKSYFDAPSLCTSSPGEHGCLHNRK